MGNMFIDENNDSMAFLRGNDLRDLLLYVQSRLLEYRDLLGLPANVTFGLELEYENFSKHEVDTFIKDNFKNWKSASESTVSAGGEIKSPVLYDNVKSLEDLKLICNFLRENNAKAFRRAGGHIHVGCHVLGDDWDAWLCFFTLYAAYEHILFRFFYGDKINPRDTIETYAFPIGKLLSQQILRSKGQKESKVASIIDCFNSKNRALNFRNVNLERINEVLNKNTIEFRAPNGTVYEIIEQNNVNVCTKMLVTAKKKVVDIDYLNYKLKHPINYGGSEYREICLKDALEFVDLVFDNNLDKVYFLRQYLKDFSSPYNLNEPTEAKRFYKVA